MTLLFWVALATLILYFLAGLDLMVGNRTVRALRDVSPEPRPGSPRVSVIAAARNEQRNIREALQSLLGLDYPDYEIIVVDDRSEDGTGPLLDGMAAADPRLNVIHVEALPPGWLGKNHALWVGSGHATGELFLFTDADIVMEPTVLTRAVAFMEGDRLDHLAATPSMRMPGVFLPMFGASFILYFSLFARPWKARDPESRCHIGIGAFNLVRAAVYRTVGGHGTIRLRPDDDMKLGKIIKKGGYRQDVVYAPDFLAVEWYASVGVVVRGLEKNAFAGADYRVALVLLGVAFYSLCCIWPYLALFVTRGATRVMYIAVVSLVSLVFADCARFHRARPWYAVGYPAASALFVFILLRTMALNLAQGGIRWRGTFYPLAELRSNKV